MSGSADNSHSRHIGLPTGTLLIVANMIGVGVFTTTGYMVQAIPSPPAVLLAWLCGGVAAFCGALVYAELGTAISQNGGEYRFLSRIYHPAVGFVAGWVSLIVGFSAPLAAYAMAFGTYLCAAVAPEALQQQPSMITAAAGVSLIVVFAALHSLHVATGTRFHNAFTIGKIALIATFIAAGIFRGKPALLAAESTLRASDAVLSPQFAVQLVYVSFAYAGWNTAAYLAGEFRQPQRDIPLAVLGGTTIVAVLYLGLNFVFLAAAPMNELAGKQDVARVAAVSLFGEGSAKLVSLLIVAGLISTVSANTMAGPRVYEAMGRDFPALSFLALRRADGGPVVAIALQAAIAIVMVLSASFDLLITYISVTLSLSAMATVLGVFLLRRREPELVRPYRTWGFPVTPLVFIAVEGWMIVHTLQKNHLAAAISTGTIATGFALYWFVRPRGNRRAEISDLKSAI